MKSRLGAILLVGTERARVAYHRLAIVRLCPTLHVHGVVLQERDGYNMVRHGH
jgi:hypothetical protein